MINYENLFTGLLSGVAGGVIGAGLKEITQYLWGWHQAGQNKGADFHIAGTMYPKIDPNDPTHKNYLHALSEGKTHVQEMIWLGGEINLETFLGNHYLHRKVQNAMAKAKDAGILIGTMPERAERPLLKKIVGHHNTIPNNSVVQIFKKHVGMSDQGRVSGICPPTHEHYAGSHHRRVMRAMFVADRQLEIGLPEKSKILFLRDSHANRYETIMTIHKEYHQNPEKFKAARVHF